VGVCSACLGNQKFYDKKGAKVCAKEKVLFTTAFSCCIKNLVVLRALANRCDHRLVMCPLVFSRHGREDFNLQYGIKFHWS
jgi:hypothetical protein